MKRKPPNPPDGAVGYGRPPRKSQFKPGKSGNPNGRPKGSKNLRTLVEDVANLKVNVRDGGRERKVNVLQAGLLRVAEKVVAGDTKAFATLLALVQQNQPDQIESIDAAELSADDKELLREFVSRKRRGEIE